MLQTKCTQAFSPYLSPLQSAGLSAGTTAARRTCGDKFVKFIRYALPGSTVLQAGSAQTMDRILLNQLRFSPTRADAGSPRVADELHEPAMNHEPGHARSRLTTKLSPGSFAKSPLQANRLLETAAFTNPTSQILPLAKQPDQSISNPTKPSAARPVHQHDPAAKNCPPAKDRQPAKELPADQRTVSWPKNRPPAKEPSAGQKTAYQTKPSAARPNCLQPDQTPTGQRTTSRPKNRQPAKEPTSQTAQPYFRALPSLKALPTLAPRGR